MAIGSGQIVVGAEGHGSGAAYVFTGAGSSWTQQAELDDPGHVAGDTFGWPVTISSTSIMVSATGENSYAGAIFIYALVNHQWALKSQISDPGDAANDLFGTAAAATGKKLVVGAPGTDGAKGAAYYFNEVRGGWVKEATLTANNGDGCSTTCSQPVCLIYGDYFGDSVALKGGTIVSGAPYASYPVPQPDSVGSGAAYVFTGSKSTWTQNSELADPAEDAVNSTSPSPCYFFNSPECLGVDFFGYQVALLGTTVVAAAPYDSEGYSNPAGGTGAAFVIPKKGGTWPSSSPTKLVATDHAVGNYFGYSGLTTIGRHIIVVGSPYSANGGLYLFEN